MTNKFSFRLRSLFASLLLCGGVLTRTHVCAEPLVIPPGTEGAAGTKAGVTSTVHDFERWEKEIAAMEESDKTNPPPKDAALFIGSSTIRMWKTLAQDFPQTPVINRGFGGSEIVDSTHFAERLIFPHAPKQVFIRAGGNDLHAGKTPEQVFADFKEFVAKVHGKLPETEIVFISLSPSVARWPEAARERALNGMVADFARDKTRVKFLNVADVSLDASGQPRPELFISDKLHFNAEGYKLLAERVRPAVQRVQK